jgi:hypothetical protein
MDLHYQLLTVFNMHKMYNLGLKTQSKMQRLLSVCALVAVLFFASCDKVSNPFITKNGNATIPVTPPTHVDSTLRTDDTVLKVLVEDYTAHHCTNCPTGSSNCEKIIDGTYGKHAVMIEVNASLLGQGYTPTYWGLPASDSAYVIDYRTKAGNNWNNVFINGDGNGMPGTMVDRLYYNGTAGSSDLYLYGISENNTFDSLIGVSPSAKMSQTATIHIVDSMYAPPVNTVSMSITAKLASPQAGCKYYMVALLMEDSIYDWQDSMSTDKRYYLHRWMMRTVINNGGTGWGDSIAATTAPQAYHYVFTSPNFKFNSAPITAPPAISPRFWNMAHMYVVAFVYQQKAGKNDYLVLQAQRLHL